MKKENDITLNSGDTIDQMFEILSKDHPHEENNTQSQNCFLILDQENRRVKMISKEDLLSGQDELGQLEHPFFAEKFKGANKDESSPPKEILSLEKTENVVLFSPHPDDDILGAGGLLAKCFSEGINTKVVYMTSGASSSSGSVRQTEATNAIKKLGGSADNLFFANMPFYERKDKKVTEEDEMYLSKILLENGPTTVFICADIFDPNKTHKKCFELLMKVLTSDSEYKNIFEQIKIYFYYSVWYWPDEREYTHILPYDFTTYKAKIYAMLEHQSQLETKFMGGDPRPFYQRATARDRKFGMVNNYDYCEVYFRVL